MGHTFGEDNPEYTKKGGSNILLINCKARELPVCDYILKQ